MAANFQNLLLLLRPIAILHQIGTRTIRAAGSSTLAHFVSCRTNLLGLRLSDGAAVTLHGNVKAITNRQNILVFQI
jgi:hypothetical protein